MNGVLHRAAFSIPFACLVALTAHAVRFGDDHAFGGDAHEAIVAAAVGGTIAIGVAILHAFLTAGTTTPTGTIAAARARDLIPGAGSLFAAAATMYYAIESLEGNGIELGLPTVLLALVAALLARALRAIVARFAAVVSDMLREWLALLDRRPQGVRLRSPHARPIHSQIIDATRRLGRAPPNGRRFS